MVHVSQNGIYMLNFSLILTNTLPNCFYKVTDGNVFQKTTFLALRTCTSKQDSILTRCGFGILEADLHEHWQSTYHTGALQSTSPSPTDCGDSTPVVTKSTTVTLFNQLCLNIQPMYFTKIDHKIEFKYHVL